MSTSLTNMSFVDWRYDTSRLGFYTPASVAQPPQPASPPQPRWPRSVRQANLSLKRHRERRRCPGEVFGALCNGRCADPELSWPARPREPTRVGPRTTYSYFDPPPSDRAISLRFSTAKWPAAVAQKLTEKWSILAERSAVSAAVFRSPETRATDYPTYVDIEAVIPRFSTWEGQVDLIVALFHVLGRGAYVSTADNMFRSLRIHEKAKYWHVRPQA